MNWRISTFACCLGMLTVPAVFGFNSDSSSLTRTFDQTISLTNSAVVVTATFVNSGTNTLRGFYYTDQVPSNMVLATVGVTLNEVSRTNYTFECGESGDVYAACTPYRWVLEQPTNFTEANPVSSQTSVQIVYSVTSPEPGLYDFQQFEWAGNFAGTTNTAFGYSEDSDRKTVRFLTLNTPPWLTGTLLTNQFVLRLEGVPGTNYVIEASTDHLNWTALATNASPIQLTNTTDLSRRYYRGRLF
jgi:hypothetical protein